MVGLEQYQGMTDSEKLTVLLVKMDAMERRFEERPPCPSTRCGEHDRRLTTLETAHAQDDKHAGNIIAWVSLGVAILSALAAVWAAAGGF